MSSSHSNEENSITEVNSIAESIFRKAKQNYSALHESVAGQTRFTLAELHDIIKRLGKIHQDFLAGLNRLHDDEMEKLANDIVDELETYEKILKCEQEYYLTKINLKHLETNEKFKPINEVLLKLQDLEKTFQKLADDKYGNAGKYVAHIQAKKEKLKAVTPSLFALNVEPDSKEQPIIIHTVPFI